MHLNLFFNQSLNNKFKVNNLANNTILTTYTIKLELHTYVGEA